MQTKQRILTVLLALCVAFTMMPLAGITGLAAYAADGKGAEGEYLNVPAKFDQEIDISKVSGDIVIKDSKTYRIYSSESRFVSRYKIKIQKPTFKSIDPHVFIDGISISMDGGSKCPAIEINNKASAYLYFYGGDSDLRGADYRAAIQKNRSEGDLHILVAGGTRLFCYGGLYAAGIGGSADRNTNWYNIDMYGHGVRLYFGSSETNTKWNGEIRATGGKNGAGIGGGSGTEQGNISTLCPARSPQKAAIMAQVSAAEEEEAETISVFMEEISLRPAEVLRPVLAAVSRRAQRKYEFMAVRLPLRPEWAAPESAAAL